MNEKDEYREDMVHRLHHDDCWYKLRVGEQLLLGCPICGASILSSMKVIHIIWHEVNNA